MEGGIATTPICNPHICRIMLGTAEYFGVLWGDVGCCGVLWGTMGLLWGILWLLQVTGGTVGYWGVLGVLGSNSGYWWILWGMQVLGLLRGTWGYSAGIAGTVG